MPMPWRLTHKLKITAGESGEVDAGPTAFDADDAEDKVWRIFLKANLTNNPRDWQAMRKREVRHITSL